MQLNPLLCGPYMPPRTATRLWKIACRGTTRTVFVHLGLLKNQSFQAPRTYELIWVGWVSVRCAGLTPQESGTGWWTGELQSDCELPSADLIGEAALRSINSRIVGDAEVVPGCSSAFLSRPRNGLPGDQGAISSKRTSRPLQPVRGVSRQRLTVAGQKSGRIIFRTP